MKVKYRESTCPKCKQSIVAHSPDDISDLDMAKKIYEHMDMCNPNAQKNTIVGPGGVVYSMEDLVKELTKMNKAK